MIKQKLDIKTQVTNKIIALMEQGTESWQQTWKAGAASGIPKNAITQNSYSGINILILWAETQEKFYKSNSWLTYKQAQSVGAQVRKGEKSVSCVYFSMVKKKKENSKDPEEFYPMAKAFNLFNVAQIDNLPEQYQANQGDIDIQFNANEAAERFLSSTGADIRHVTTKAWYQPSGDFISMPNKGDFFTPENYYATVFHELTHWTGHKSRLDRDFSQSKRFGDDAYAFEELVAELGAAFLCGHFGFIDATVENHASYLDSWLKVLKADKNAIFTAASKANEAYSFLVNDQELKKAA